MEWNGRRNWLQVSPAQCYLSKDFLISPSRCTSRPGRA
jgi:hypothetical protein